MQNQDVTYAQSLGMDVSSPINSNQNPMSPTREQG